jgi:HlyD family secretion protein
VLLVSNGALRWRPSGDLIHPDAREEYLKSLKQPPRRAGLSSGEAKPQQGTVWVPDGRFIRPVKVTIGLTDGTMTEITGDNLPEGTEVVVGMQTAGGGEDAVSPFQPQIFKGSKPKQPQ